MKDSVFPIEEKWLMMFTLNMTYSVFTLNSGSQPIKAGLSWLFYNGLDLVCPLNISLKWWVKLEAFALQFWGTDTKTWPLQLMISIAGNDGVIKLCCSCTGNILISYGGKLYNQTIRCTHSNTKYICKCFSSYIVVMHFNLKIQKLKQSKAYFHPQQEIPVMIQLPNLYI